MSLNSTRVGHWRSLTRITANWRTKEWSDFSGETCPLYRIGTPKPTAKTEPMIDGYHVVVPMTALTTTTATSTIPPQIKLVFSSGNASSGTGAMESGGRASESPRFGAPWDMLSRIDIEDGRTVEVELSEPPGSVFFDDVRGRLVITAESSLAYYDENLRRVGSSRMPSLRGTSRLSAAVDPGTGDYWLLRAGNPTAVRLVFVDESRYEQRDVVLESARDPRAITIDNAGHLFVSEDGRMVEYTARGARAESSPFGRMPAGELLQLSRDLIDRDPPGEIHDEPPSDDDSAEDLEDSVVPVAFP